MYGSETVLWKEKERSRIRAVQMDNLRILLSSRRMDRIPNAWVKEWCRVTKGLDEGVHQWFGHVERIENDRFANIVYIGECVASRSVRRPWKR